MNGLRQDISFSMPWAMLVHLPFREQVRAVKLAEFQSMSLHPYNIGRALDSGMSLAEMKDVLDGEGVAISRIDPLAAWVPEWRAHNFGPELNYTTATDALVIFDLASHFGASHVSLNAMWSSSRYTVEELADYYRAICERAAPYGLTCDIEPIPMWAIPRLEDALEIIARADVANAGIVLDTTHFCRGQTPLEVLRTMPGQLITTVQLCDGFMPRPADLTLEQECFNRLWPGDGGFPLAEILRTLDQTGGLNGVGPEVFSSVYATDNTPAEAIARQSREAMLRYPELAA